MRTLKQLRDENPALNKYTDDELERWYLNVREIAEIMVRWYIETDGGSKSMPEGFLSNKEEVE